MELGYVERDLNKLDSERGEVLVSGVFEDVRPLQGVLGLIDWRLTGFLSRCLRATHMNGKLGQVSLIPGRRSAGFERIVTVGLGTVSSFSADIAAAQMKSAFDALRDMRVRRAHIEIFGRDNERYSAELGTRALIQALGDWTDAKRHFDEIRIVDCASGEAGIRAVVLAEERRARANLE